MSVPESQSARLIAVLRLAFGAVRPLASTVHSLAGARPDTSPRGCGPRSGRRTCGGCRTVKALNLTATAAELRRAAMVVADLILSDGKLIRGEREKRVNQNIAIILGRTLLEPPQRP
jgi:hypothetical protein